MKEALRPTLWILFAVLVATGAIFFLRACGTSPLLGLGQNFCPVPFDRKALDREIDTGERLHRQVHAAEIALLQVPVCAPPPPPPPPSRQKIESDRIDKQVRQKGGKTGKLQFTLLWHTLDDLDINVDCPGGRVGSGPGQRGPGICGDGVKDLDANRNLRENVSTNPVENVIWQNDIPDGTYKIEIIEYMQASDNGNTVPFTLRMKWGDQEKVCNDVVTATPMSETAREDGFVIGGTYRTITWVKGDDLPDCDFEIGTSHRGSGKK